MRYMITATATALGRSHGVSADAGGRERGAPACAERTRATGTSARAQAGAVRGQDPLPALQASLIAQRPSASADAGGRERGAPACAERTPAAGMSARAQAGAVRGQDPLPALRGRGCCVRRRRRMSAMAEPARLKCREIHGFLPTTTGTISALTGVRALRRRLGIPAVFHPGRDERLATITRPSLSLFWRRR